MFRVDPWLSKTFSLNTYNCFDFAREVWRELTGVDLGDQVPEPPNIKAYQIQAVKVSNTLKKLTAPANPCIVLFQRSGVEPHIGIFYNGKVLHLNQQGAYYVPLLNVARDYQTVSFYV